MKMEHSTLWVLQTLLVLLSPVVSTPCPRPCSCPQPAELHCTFRSLLTVPAAVPKHVKRINLGFNSIYKISDTSLSGLGKLELLMVHGNNIHSLPDGAFRDLASLQMLKMSYNKLKEINRHTLQGLWSVTRLHLDHNQIELIHPDAFQGLTSLRFLQLEGNQLQQLHPATFTTFTLMGQFYISTLRHLYLSDNALTSLPFQLVETIPQLENLYLHGNPWTCDCSMSWLHDWEKTSPGVLKCKKDRALSGGQLCPMCSSPIQVKEKELQAAHPLVCNSPVISFLHRITSLEYSESETLTSEDFKEPIGNISLGLSDEHGNELDLECSAHKLKEPAKVRWEQVNQLQLVANVSFSVDLQCSVDREKYEQLWRLIAYYSNVPAHLKQRVIPSQEPYPPHVYSQDSVQDAHYYTGLKAKVSAQPAWLMQPSIELQLNRPQSSTSMVKLILRTNFSETVDIKLQQRLRRNWVMIESTNRTQNAMSVILGSSNEMACNVHSSDLPVIQWMLPDSSKLNRPFRSPENRVSVSRDGRLKIKAVTHRDTGAYYCIAKVQGDFAVLSFYLTVQESSSPPTGEDTSIASIEEFAGNSISLDCPASSSPDAEINWILPNNKIIYFRANYSKALVTFNGTLQILKTQISDSGYYKCVAINQHGVDTLVKKVSIVRRNGLIRPMRKFTTRPQSASGVNTQINVPTENPEEASGDSDGSTIRHRISSVRRKLPVSLVPGRRGIHPSRSTWQRQPVFRKPTGSHNGNLKGLAENRRRINLSKSKIDPEKWADILAKIRDRNTVTSPPVSFPTKMKATELPTQSWETSDEPSDGVTVHERVSQHYSIRQSPEKPTEYSTHGQDSHVTPESITAEDATPNSRFVTIEPHPTEIAYTTQHTTYDTELNLITSSNSGFFLPQTTSVPPHAITVRQPSAHTATSSTFSFSENLSTSITADKIQTADPSEGLQSSESRNKPNDVTNSINHREAFFMESQITPSVNPNHSAASQEGSGNYLSETSTLSQFQSHPKDTTLNDLHSEVVDTTGSPTTTFNLPGKRRVHSTRRPKSRLRKVNSQRRNGGRRRRPDRKKQKLKTLGSFITTAPVNTPLPTAKTSASKLLNTERSEIAVCLYTSVPFTESQVASSDRMSHKESTVFSQNHEVIKEPSSLPTSSLGTKDSQNKSWQSTAAAPSFPSISPGLTHGNTTPHSTAEISDSAYPTAISEILPSIPQQRFADSPPPPAEHLENWHEISFTTELAPLLHSESPSWGLQSMTKLTTDNKNQQFVHQETFSEDVEQIHWEKTGMDSSLQPSYFTQTASPIQGNKTDSGETSKGSLSTPRMLFEVTTERLAPLEDLKSEENEKKPPNAGADSTHMSSVKTTHASATSTLPYHIKPSREIPYLSKPRLSTLVPLLMSLSTSITQNATVTVRTSQDQQIKPISTTSVLRRSFNFHPTTFPPNHKPTNTIPTSQASTSIPVPTGIPSQKTLSPVTLDVSTQHLNEHGSVQRRKPRIKTTHSQMITVKVEKDAKLPCETGGQPMFFLSWTKVSNGASIARNMKVQRFEVLHNGTLIIRNSQLTDEGQYVCTVQNQYGTDKMMANLIVMSHHPRVLQPRERDIHVYEGSKVELECKVEGDPVPRVKWVLPNSIQLMTTSPSVPSQWQVAVDDSGTLHINQASLTDSGIYRCTGSSAAGADTVSVHLHVSAMPSLIQQRLDENMTFPEGSAAYIDCTATRASQPIIHWITPDGIQLTPSRLITRDNLTVFPNGTLHIQRLDLKNSGRYVCKASNGVASSSRTVMLSIRRKLLSAKATITSSSPHRTDVIYGSKLLLNCVATGEPEPRIIWRTPSKKLVDNQYSFESRIKVFLNGSISIHSVTDKDGGDYLCVARNKMGDDYVQLWVNVLTKPATIEQKLQKSSQEVVQGQDLKVDCVASGLPSPEISWALPDGTMVNPIKQKAGVHVGRSRRYVVFDNGTLYFNDVGQPEEGDYTCYAQNQLGRDEMKVRVKVKGGTSSPQIQDKDHKTVRVLYGETVTLQCNAKGDPVPVVTWMSPKNRPISNAIDRYKVLKDGTLLVQNVQQFDEGNYTCMARNSVGQDNKVTRVEVLATPLVINGLRGTSNTIKVTAVQGERKLLDCVTEGTPSPRIMWILPGNLILPAPYYSNHMTVHQNGTLEIQSAKKTDSGQMVCVARNERGEVRMLVNLDVKEMVGHPQIDAPQRESFSLKVGNTVTLNCSIDGLELTDIMWTLPSGTPLQAGARISKFFHRLDGSLIINNPSVADVGMYRCVGHNSAGIFESTVTLSPGRKPQILNRYISPVSILDGETLFLHCQTTGEPFKLTWTLPSGVVLNRLQKAGRYSILRNGTIVIRQASVYDRGPYVCRAANEYGSSLLSVSVNIFANQPRITSGPPSVTYAKNGVAVQLNCVATGLPKVEVAWETPDKTRLVVSAKPRLFGNKYLHPQGSLIIQNPTQRDSGVYRCTARNTAGVDSKTTFLNVF
ncbi:matrix-remodeling-associated protein 5 isoform X1 [Xiphophorus couchianus]|uniref:matrix-remodeling-associated protein 5 isoform X1 n=1 Tax=Xiphophorus couchianus TaxID=32473 RepID=UPI001015D15C|nr:matrix-remodeling-associated protein 5 isoform X1 [Xiphophorus couchianus]XP_027866864.1 matrix-remodeling-associated protein 5 isoform X1 [Xiphophorus couchianus]XP_027866865.1 matrix-remodeling-associated protein 5 isoform X1 [Xiphophorus couchianus]